MQLHRNHLLVFGGPCLTLAERWATRVGPRVSAQVRIDGPRIFLPQDLPAPSASSQMSVESTEQSERYNGMMQARAQALACICCAGIVRDLANRS
jgi:hypothetical protein